MLALKVEVKLAFSHCGDVGQHKVDRGIGPIGVVDDAVVSVDLFPLEGRPSCPLLATLVAKDRYDGKGSILGEPLRREGEMNCYGHLASDHFEGLRGGFYLVSRHGA